MRGHLLRDFQLSAVLQIRGNSGCAKRVAPDEGFDADARSAQLQAQILSPLVMLKERILTRHPRFPCIML